MNRYKKWLKERVYGAEGINETIYQSLLKAEKHVKDHDRIACSISGGADSDVMLDIMTKVDPERKTKYVWFNTGLEYQATKDHIKELENKYGVKIQTASPKKAIPTAVKEHGVPFLSKYVSEQIQRLQRHGFQWENEPFEKLAKKYSNCECSLKWWCNARTRADGSRSRYDIGQNKWLKEFILANPPTFLVSNKCCTYAKKDVAKKFNKAYNTDLNCTGVRKAEGGVRATAYNTCYSICTDKYDEFRPIFWYKDADKLLYENIFNVTHSKCYTEYGLKRTGCVGCPYGRNFEEELEIIQKYEPKLYGACMNIFGKSYEYTRKYREFQKMMNEKEKRGEI